VSELPDGWAETAVNALVESRSGNSKLIKGTLLKEPTQDSFPAFSASGQDVWVEQAEHEGEAIIVSAVGARCGKAFLASGQWSAVANTHIIFPHRDSVDQRWLWFRLNDENFWERGGSAQPFVKVTKSLEAVIPLAPLPEQRRIVAKVDGLTARTARARGELNRIPTLIARYKQRLLALAFSGELTAGWRKENPSSSVQSRAKVGIDGRSAALGDIPLGWNWTSFGEMAGVTGGLTKNKTRDNIKSRALYLRVANVYANELRLDDVTEIGCTETELAKTLLLAGDLLIVEGNGSIEQVGRVALWNGEIDVCSHQNHIIRARPNPDLIPRYGLFWLLSPGGRSAIEGVASSSSGLHTLSITKVKGFPIPVCPWEEQAEIVRRIESAFGWLDRMAADHAAAARLIPKLDAAILSKAFRGALVPQDPNDEPASVLLDRIRAERVLKTKPTRLISRPKEARDIPPFKHGTTSQVTRRIAPKVTNMAKSRQDDDVQGQPYLATKLKTLHRADVQTLFRDSNLPVADFYKQLAWEIDNGHIIDNPKALKAA
jgi:type I restriction enzyme, S subunit